MSDSSADWTLVKRKHRATSGPRRATAPVLPPASAVDDQVILRRDKVQKTATPGRRPDSKLEQEIDEGKSSIRHFSVGFLEKVRDFRRQKQLSQDQLSQELRVSPSVVRQLEAGKLPYDPVLKSRLERLFTLRMR
ncbi:MAG: helix-turn-helix domain-containing protein [Sulfobacillus sp.]